MNTYQDLSAIRHARTPADFEALFDSALDVACVLNPDTDDVHALVAYATRDLGRNVRKLWCANVIDADTAEQLQAGINAASGRLQRIADMFTDHVVTLEGID